MAETDISTAANCIITIYRRSWLLFHAKFQSEDHVRHNRMVCVEAPTHPRNWRKRDNILEFVFITKPKTYNLSIRVSILQLGNCPQVTIPQYNGTSELLHLLRRKFDHLRNQETSVGVRELSLGLPYVFRLVLRSNKSGHRSVSYCRYPLPSNSSVYS